MKKVTFVACLLLVLLTQVVFAQQSNRRNNAQNEGGPGGPGGGMFRMFGEARTEDGRIDLSKLPKEMDEQMKKAFTEADKNKDKFLDQEEQRGAMQTLGPMMGGMMGGGPGGPGGIFRMLGEARTEDGRIDLSKLPKEMDEQIKKAFTEADKNKDKFLNEEEIRGAMQTLGPMMGGMMGGGPGGPGGIFQMLGGARTEDGRIDLSKLPAEMDAPIKLLISQADSNKDGFIDQEETMAIMQAFGPMMGGMMGGPGGMGQPNPFGEALTEDSRIQISKLPKNFDLMGKKPGDMKKADKDKDGYLNVEEMKAAFPEVPEFLYNRAARPQRGGFNRGPGMPGGMGQEGQRGQRGQVNAEDNADPFAAAKTADGKIELSKLPRTINATMRRNIQAADLDKDGFLDESEQKSISLK